MQWPIYFYHNNNKETNKNKFKQLGKINFLYNMRSNNVVY